MSWLAQSDSESELGDQKRYVERVSSSSMILAAITNEIMSNAAAGSLAISEWIAL